MSASGSPAGSYQLELLQGDVVASRHPLSLRPLRLGRGANNDIILVDDAASTNHARVWVEVDGPRVEDLGSRNGTWVNGGRLAGIARLGPEDEVRVGGGVGLRVRALDAGAGAVPHLEDLVTGNRYAFQCDRLSLGDGPDADIQVPGAKVGCAILVEPDGSVWLGGSDSLVAITVGQTFEVGGRPFRLAHSSPHDGVTRELLLPHELAAARYPYTLQVRLAGPTGPQATFGSPRTGAAHTILAENPALLAYVLGRQHLTDRAAGASPSERGWVTDYDLAVGIWGRAEGSRQASNLNVLIWRVRRELLTAGFDPWCLEKRRKHTRLRLDTVDLL